MNAHERRIRAFEVATNQCDVLVLIHVAGVGNHSKVTVASGQYGFGDATDIPLVLHPVADEVGYREHLHVVLAAKFVQLRNARHRAVFVHDFADDGGWIEAGDASEVNAGFGLAGADEHASVASTKREDVAGT